MIPIFQPYTNEEEINALKEVLDSHWLGLGPKTAEFEKAFASYIGINYAVGLNSGTSALDLAIRLLNIKKGDEVLVPTMTFVSTAHAVIYNRAKPIFVDIDPRTLNIDIDDVKHKLTANIKAVIAVHYSGRPVDIDTLKESIPGNVKIIEDAAHAAGASYKGKKCGSLADIAAFSFHAVKPLACFPPNTKIIKKPTFKGSGSIGGKEIKDLKIKDEVLTYDEKTGMKEYQPVTQLFEREYDGEIITIKLSNDNELSMTEDHPIFVVEKGYISALKLIMGDKLVQFKYPGLALRITGIKERGKTVEEIFGTEKGKAMRKAYSESRSGEKHHMFGKHHSEETKNKIKESCSKYIVTDVTKRKQKIAQIKRFERLRTLEKEKYKEFCEKIKIAQSNPELKRKRAIWIKENQHIVNSPEATRKRIESYKKTMADPEVKKRKCESIRKTMEKASYWEAFQKGCNRKKNKAETLLETILNKVHLNEFKFNGNYELGISLDGLFPDFVNVNGKKKVIELFGRYWHEDRDEQIKIKRYKKVGWDCLVIWDNELKDVEILKKKILNYTFNPNVEVVEIMKIIKTQYKGKVYNIETEKNHNYFAYGILVHNCGDGGALTLNNEEMIQRARRLRWLGIDKGTFDRTSQDKSYFWDYNVEEIGYKYHMNDLQAAIALVQLKKLDNGIAIRREKANLYSHLLSEVIEIECPLLDDEIYKSSWHIYCIKCKKRDELFAFLRENGITTGVHYRPIHLYACYGRKKPYLKNAEEVFKKILTLPLFVELTFEEIKYIVEKIKEFYAKDRAQVSI